MNLKPIVFACLLASISNSYADNHHGHYDPKDTAQLEIKASPSMQANYAGLCEIEIINSSFDDVRVRGVFDDGYPLWPFVIYSYESPHYISLYYDGYCHYGMDLFIDTYYDGYPIYSGYTYRKSTVFISPYLREKVKAEVVRR